jgi:glyoxylase-like metal-dependent hydrolase (beta-lactamase superfamily II)
MNGTSFEREAAPGIHRVECAYTNFYLVEDEAGDLLTLVDAGVPAAWSELESALEQLGRSRDQIAALVLTHAHFDHVGIAERLRRERGVPVHVHENDVPLARHPLQYSHEESRLKALLHPGSLPIMAALTRARAFFPDGVREVTRYDQDAGTLDVPGSPTVVFTPGHTLGHCALHFADRDALIAGDAIVNLDPYTGDSGPRLVSGAATADRARALGSLEAIAETGAEIVLTGHGETWTDGARPAVEHAREAALTAAAV